MKSSVPKGKIVFITFPHSGSVPWKMSVDTGLPQKMVLMMKFKVYSSEGSFSPQGRRSAIIDSSDITLASNDGGHFRAHQSVLAAASASPLFVFPSEQANAPALIRHLNISGRSMYWMLDLIYDGEVQIPFQDS